MVRNSQTGVILQLPYSGTNKMELLDFTESVECFNQASQSNKNTHTELALQLKISDIFRSNFLLLFKESYQTSK